MNHGAPEEEPELDSPISGSKDEVSDVVVGHAKAVGGSRRGEKLLIPTNDRADLVVADGQDVPPAYSLISAVDLSVEQGGLCHVDAAAGQMSAAVRQDDAGEGSLAVDGEAQLPTGGLCSASAGYNS